MEGLRPCFNTFTSYCAESGETRLVLHVPSSSWAGKRNDYYCCYYTVLVLWCRQETGGRVCHRLPRQPEHSSLVRKAAAAAAAPILQPTTGAATPSAILTRLHQLGGMCGGWWRGIQQIQVGPAVCLLTSIPSVSLVRVSLEVSYRLGVHPTGQVSLSEYVWKPVSEVGGFVGSTFTFCLPCTPPPSPTLLSSTHAELLLSAKCQQQRKLKRKQ